MEGRSLVALMKARRISAGAAASVVVLLSLATLDASSASATHKLRHPAPSPSAHDTDTTATATIPDKSQAKTAPPASVAKDEPLPPPFQLPQASRKRMRDCGLKWQSMKSSGEAAEQIWRDFATQCLAAASGPYDTRSAN